MSVKETTQITRQLNAIYKAAHLLQEHFVDDVKNSSLIDSLLNKNTFLFHDHLLRHHLAYLKLDRLHKNRLMRLLN